MGMVMQLALKCIAWEFSMHFRCVLLIVTLAHEQWACDVRDGVPPFPNWRRPWGHPPITWLRQICSDCGLSAGDALNCAQDRAV